MHGSISNMCVNKDCVSCMCVCVLCVYACHVCVCVMQRLIQDSYKGMSVLGGRISFWSLFLRNPLNSTGQHNLSSTIAASNLQL